MHILFFNDLKPYQWRIGPPGILDVPGRPYLVLMYGGPRTIYQVGTELCVMKI